MGTGPYPRESALLIHSWVGPFVSELQLLLGDGFILLLRTQNRRSRSEADETCISLG